MRHELLAISRSSDEHSLEHCASNLEEICVQWCIAPFQSSDTTSVQTQPRRLKWTVDCAEKRAVAEVFSSDDQIVDRRIYNSERVQIVHDEMNGCVHIDVSHVFSATLKCDETQVYRLVYSRTTLLSELGVPGGRYNEPDLVHIERTKKPAARATGF